MLRILPIALAAALVLPASASAATVSGHARRWEGYTVIALSVHGPVLQVGGRARRAASSSKLPGKGATLQLVKPDGSYFGPVVLRASGKRAFVGLSAKGGKLGRIALKRGFAAAAKAPKAAVAKHRDRPRQQGRSAARCRQPRLRQDRQGRRPRSRRQKSKPGADPDGDGIPSTFDADDNGNKTLDGVDPVTAKTDTAGLFSDVQVMMARSVNANAERASPARRSTRSSQTTRA